MKYWSCHEKKKKKVKILDIFNNYTFIKIEIKELFMHLNLYQMQFVVQ